MDLPCANINRFHKPHIFRRHSRQLAIHHRPRNVEQYIFATNVQLGMPFYEFRPFTDISNSQHFFPRRSISIVKWANLLWSCSFSQSLSFLSWRFRFRNVPVNAQALPSHSCWPLLDGYRAKGYSGLNLNCMYSSELFLIMGPSLTLRSLWCQFFWQIAS